MGGNCLFNGSCCSKRCIKTNANGKCGPSWKDKKMLKKEKKVKQKKEEKETKEVKKTLEKARKKDKQVG